MTPQQAREELQAKRTDAPTRFGLIDDTNILTAAAKARTALAQMDGRPS